MADCLDAGYSMRFSDHFSGGITLRYVHSDLVNDVSTPIPTAPTKPGTSIAGDLGLYYRHDLPAGAKNGEWAMELHHTKNRK